MSNCENIGLIFCIVIIIIILIVAIICYNNCNYLDNFCTYGIAPDCNCYKSVVAVNNSK